MKPTSLTFQAEITPDRKLKWLGATRETVLQMLSEAFPTGTIEVRFNRKTKRRTNPQNAYYWSVVLPHIHAALVELGNDIDEEEAHDFLKNNFIPSKRISDRDGLNLGLAGKSTTKLTTVEFNAYLERVCRFALEDLNNLYIPPPPEKERTDIIHKSI